MIPQLFFERYFQIQVQMLDRKISILKDKIKNVNSELMRDYRYRSILLERKKYKILREYNQFKQAGLSEREDFSYKINSELQDVCKLYNSLFSQVESSY